MACRHLWPADTPWINYEPYLFDSAADTLSGAGLATRGLGGSVGVLQPDPGLDIRWPAELEPGPGRTPRQTQR